MCLSKLRSMGESIIIIIIHNNNNKQSKVEVVRICVIQPSFCNHTLMYVEYLFITLVLDFSVMNHKYKGTEIAPCLHPTSWCSPHTLHNSESKYHLCVLSALESYISTLLGLIHLHSPVYFNFGPLQSMQIIYGIVIHIEKCKNKPPPTLTHRHRPHKPITRNILRNNPYTH